MIRESTLVTSSKADRYSPYPRERELSEEQEKTVVEQVVDDAQQKQEQQDTQHSKEKNIKKLGRDTPKVKSVERTAYTFPVKRKQAGFVKQEPNSPY